MRRQSFLWTFLVLAIVLSIYGGYSLIYSSINGKAIPVLGLIFCIVGGTMLLIFFVLLIISLFQNRKKKSPKAVPKEEKVEGKPQIKDEEEKEPEVKKETTRVSNSSMKSDVTYSPRRNNSRYDNEDYSAYINKTGYGPVIRVEGNRIFDMRTNTYYVIDGNFVNQSGSGPVFEISENRIKSAFGSYLYEISGGNVNKVYGGFYASINGNIIQVHDLSEKYEISNRLSLKQQLVVVVLLFGAY